VVKEAKVVWEVRVSLGPGSATGATKPHTMSLLYDRRPSKQQVLDHLQAEADIIGQSDDDLVQANWGIALGRVQAVRRTLWDTCIGEFGITGGEVSLRKRHLEEGLGEEGVW
jgi:hypothetical protein